jgi:hypothetical protein
MKTRRHFLRSSSATLALPFLESVGFRRFAAAAAPVTPAKRMIFIAMGYGVTQETWFPDRKQTGPGFTLPPGLAPLARHKDDITIVQGLSNRYSEDAHAGSTFWLTGANPHESGAAFHNGISADQVAAAAFGKDTRFASLQLNGSDKDLSGPGHGPGLSLAWDNRGKPVGGQNSPLAAFSRLFSAENVPLDQLRLRLAQKRSMLDTVMEEAQDLQRGLAKNDVDKLDEYFQGIREIEVRLAKDEQWLSVPKPKSPLQPPPEGSSGQEEIRLMYDLMAAALQTDSTRVISYRLPIAKLGHHLVVSKDTPLCNAWLTLLQGSGLDLERHGDSSGVVKELIA